jgi:hypothetical protein
VGPTHPVIPVNESCGDVHVYVSRLIPSFPLDDKALAAIEGMTSAHIRAYGPKLLAVCIKFKPFTALDTVARPAASAGAHAPLQASSVAHNLQAYAYNPSRPNGSGSKASSNSNTGKDPTGKTGAGATGVVRTTSLSLSSSDVGTKSGGGSTTLLGRPNGVRPLTIAKFNSATRPRF